MMHKILKIKNNLRENLNKSINKYIMKLGEMGTKNNKIAVAEIGAKIMKKKFGSK